MPKIEEIRNILIMKQDLRLWPMHDWHWFSGSRNEVWDLCNHFGLCLRWPLSSKVMTFCTILCSLQSERAEGQRAKESSQLSVCAFKELSCKSCPTAWLIWPWWEVSQSLPFPQPVMAFVHLWCQQILFFSLITEKGVVHKHWQSLQCCFRGCCYCYHCYCCGTMFSSADKFPKLGSIKTLSPLTCS